MSCDYKGIRASVKAEARALRDVDAGHITLSAQVRNYDTQTGAQLPEPVVTVRPDRVPAGLDANWWCWAWGAGFLALNETASRPHLYVTTEGSAHVAAVLAEHEED